MAASMTHILQMVDKIEARLHFSITERIDLDLHRSLCRAQLAAALLCCSCRSFSILHGETTAITSIVFV